MKEKFIKENSDFFHFSEIAKKLLKKKKAVQFDDKFYAELKKEFWNGPYGECLKNEETIGNCYFYALFLAKSIKDSTLKIGVLNRLNMNVRGEYYQPFHHSWVEYGNFVLDTSLKMVFLKTEYYNKYFVEALKTFSYDDLKNEQTFFELGCNAVSYRNELFGKFYKVVEKAFNKDKDNFLKIAKKYGVENLFYKQENKENTVER